MSEMEDPVDKHVLESALKTELLIMAICVSNLAVLQAKKIRRKIKESDTDEGRLNVKLSNNYYRYKIKSLVDSKENRSIRNCITNFDNHLANSIDSTIEFVSSAIDKAYEEMQHDIWVFECEVKKVLNTQNVEDSNLLGLIDMDMRLLATAHIFIEDLFAANRDIVRKYYWLLNDVKQLYNVMGSIANNIPIQDKEGKKIGKTLPKLTECERVVKAYKSFVSPFYDPNFIERIMLYALDKIDDTTKDIA